MKQFLKYTLASMFGVIVAFTLLFLILIGIGSSLSKSDSTFEVKDNSVLKIVLNGEISEQSIDNPFNMNIPGIPIGTKNLKQGLDNILAAISRAKENSSIKGIYIETGVLRAGWSTAAEIRNALTQFKKSGKFIWAYGEMMGQKEFFICTAADSIFLNPQGMIELSGLSATPIFYKETLAKIGVEPEIFKVGTFKSAVEPYINTKMSDASRLQTASFLNGMWGEVLSQISKSRKISIETLQELANHNTTFDSGENLVKNKLADRLLYKTDMEDLLKTKVGANVNSDLQAVSPAQLMTNLNKSASIEREKIAILYADGEIFDSGSEGIVIDKIIKDITALRKDSLVKAVVFRVNSPGGSAYASEQIWKAIEDLKMVKPVVVSMGDYAASGGYYISCGASKIVASNNTLTGSIGIFGMFFNVNELTKKLGLSFDVVKTNQLSDFGNLTRAMTPLEKQKIQNYVNSGYDLFIKRCSDGRHIDDAQMRKIAEGRVWTGKQAKELGLVDEIGGIDEALKIAAKLGKISKYRLVSYPEKKDFFKQLIEDLTSDTQLKMVKWILGDEYNALIKLKTSKIQTGIVARMDPLEIN